MLTPKQKPHERQSRQEQLESQLRAVEQCAGTPFVPGELEGWIETARTALWELRPLLREHLQETHPQDFAKISQEDPELLARVGDMQEEDAAIKVNEAHIANWLDFLQARVAAGDNEGACEAELKEELDRFVTESLALVVRIRKQELAVRTWVGEAFTRDRGNAD